MDVTSDSSIENALNKVKDDLTINDEKLVGLVNNAGFVKASEFEWDEFAVFQQTIDVNTMGMIKMTRAFLPLIRKSRGRIINMAAMSARVYCPTEIAYSVSKYAVIGFCENLRKEMFKFGVKVVSIEPWFYATNICKLNYVTNAIQTAWNKAREDVKADYGIEYFENVLKQVEQIEDLTCNRVDDVVDTIINALTIYEPDTRYMVAPRLLQPFLRIIEVLPFEWNDLIVYFLLSLNRTNKPFPNKN